MGETASASDGSVHYDAFISYRHTGRDAEIAKRLQFQLEHYRIPRELQKQTGKKRFERVFRDKDELTASGALTSALEEALLNSDYLIIICSADTNKSGWIPFEIETFLSRHPIDHILTVLSEGEFPDIIPKPLLERSSTVFGFNYLSCDYRGSPRQARRVEFPRLAAAMLGCQYDDLIRRKRQYRRRVLFFSLSGCLALSTALLIYFASTNLTIRAQRDQILQQNEQIVLQNDQLLRQNDSITRQNEQILQQNAQIKNEQSANLASMSDRLLNERRRIEAIRYALEAIDAADQETGCPAAALLALQQSTRAYVPKENNRFTETRELQLSSEVDSYVLGEWDSHTYLGCVDYSGEAVIWDVSSGAVLLRAPSKEGDKFRSVAIEGGSVYLVSESALRVLRLPDMEELERVPFEEGLRCSTSLLSVSDAGAAVPLEGTGSAYMLWVYDFAKRASAIYPMAGSGAELLVLSPNGRWAAWDYVSYQGRTTHSVWLLDTETGREQQLDSFLALSDLLFRDGCLYGIGHRNVERVGILYADGARAAVRMETDAAGSVLCWAADTGAQLWESTWELWLSGSGALRFVPLEDSELLLACSRSMARLLDPETGAMVREIAFSGQVLWVFAEDYYADQSLTAILRDGSCETFCFESGKLIRRDSVFPENLISAKKAGNSVVFLLTESSQYAICSRFCSYLVDGLETAAAGRDLPAEAPDLDETWNAFDESRGMLLSEGTLDLYTAYHDAETGRDVSLSPPFHFRKTFLSFGLKEYCWKWSDDGKTVLILTDDGLSLYDAEGRRFALLELSAFNDLWLCFEGEYLFILEEDSVRGVLLHQYRKETGEELRCVTFSPPASLSIGVRCIRQLSLYQVSGDRYCLSYISAWDYAGTSYILNRELEVEQRIDSASAYDPESDSFLIKDCESNWHSIRRYSTDELIALANSQLE